MSTDPPDHFHAPREPEKPAAAPADPAPSARERFNAREIAQILSHYDIGVIREIREYRRGSRRAAKLKLVAERGEFLLKRRAAGRVFDSDRARAAASHKLQHLASKTGVPVASLMPLKSGGTLLEFGGRLYELFQWIPGTRYARHAEQARATGIALARMHGAFDGVELLEDLPLGGFSEPEPVRAMMEQAREKAIARSTKEDGESIAASVEALLAHLQRIESKLNAKGLALQRSIRATRSGSATRSAP